MTTVKELETFLYERLEGIAPVYSASIPEGSEYPAIFFRAVQIDDYCVQGERQWIVGDYEVLVRSFGRAYPFELQEQVDAVLSNVIAITDGLSIRCERKNSITRSDEVGGSSIRDAGGLYRITGSVLR